MTQTQQTDFAPFLLRVTLGIIYLAHSLVLKLATFGLAGTAGFFISVGLPGWLAYVTFAAEAVGGMLLVLGVQTRWVVVALSPALFGAIIWVHAWNGWVFTATKRLGISGLPDRREARSVPARRRRLRFGAFEAA
jgi:putative oxidoreductase